MFTTLPVELGTPPALGAPGDLRSPGPIATRTPSTPLVPVSLPGRHRIQVLRQFSGASGQVTSGQAVCNTCHWEGPRRAGGRTGLLEADAAGHASTTSGRLSGNFVAG
jgi:hypothetical protein